MDYIDITLRVTHEAGRGKWIIDISYLREEVYGGSILKFSLEKFMEHKSVMISV